MTSETFGERVRRLRTAAGLTDEELAEKADILPRRLHCMEGGTAVLHTAAEVAGLAAALDLPMGDLWHGTGKGAPDYLPHPPYAWLKQTGLTSASIEFGQVAWKLFQESGSFSNHQVMEILRAKTREEDEARRAERAAWLARHDSPAAPEVAEEA